MAYTDTSLQETLERERLKSLVNNMADGVIAIDDQLSVALYNGAALDILDVNGSIDGKEISTVFSLFDTHNQPIDLPELIRGCKSAQVFRDFRLKYTDGSTINLYLSIAPVHLGYGKTGTQGYVLLARDITREKSLEEERDEFISVVSHELRTPITIAEGNISNALLTAERSGDLKFVIDALKEAHGQVVFLASMINDLATLSRAERNKLTLEIEKFNIRDLLHELAHAYEAEAQAKGLKLTLDLDPKLELLQSNKLYVHEIIQNLVTNAIKYTESGSIHIIARQSDSKVSIAVQDSGIGISKPDQEKIFDKFFRSEDYRTRNHSGTGLGLYVTMKLMHLVKADIDVQSELNVGSTFTATFPNL
jgi:two-component system, OmpR family, phosphate regulon sensor histidine kinase PhoR